MDYDRRRVAVRFAVALAIAAALLWGVGWEAVLRELRAAEGETFALACLASTAAMFAGSEGVRIALDLPVRGFAASLARRAYLAAGFIRSFIPAGNVGGSAFVAYTVSRDDDESVSESVAGVAGWEFLNMVASATVALAGVVGIAANGGRTGAAPLVVAAFAGLLLVAGVALYALANHREPVADAVLWVARVARRTLGRVLPVLDDRLSRTHVRDGLDHFFDAIGRLVADRGRLAVTLVAAHLGWLCGTFVLYYCLTAVGRPVALPVVLLAVPLSGFALAVPIPGGIGPMDAALGGVVAFLTHYPLPELASALVLYRAATFGVHVVVGGAALWTLDRAAVGDVPDQPD